MAWIRKRPVFVRTGEVDPPAGMARDHPHRTLCKIMTTKLSERDKKYLLGVARNTLNRIVSGKPLPELDLDEVPPALREKGACFVTLKKHGQLRGCVGTLEAVSPLVVSVQNRTVAAARHDYRFPPVRVEELSHIRIEISRLTPPTAVQYSSTEELLRKLNPGCDGVILCDGCHKATFLPQVWEKFPETEDFLCHLCQKMGVDECLWQEKCLEVFVYQVDKFAEDEPLRRTTL